MSTCFICEHKLNSKEKTATFEGRDIHSDCHKGILAWLKAYEEYGKDLGRLLKRGEKVDIGNGEYLSRDKSFGMYIHHYKSRLFPGRHGKRYIPEAIARTLHTSR